MKRRIRRPFRSEADPAERDEQDPATLTQRAAARAVQRVVRDESPPEPDEMVALQQSAGNRAAAELMSKPGHDLPGPVRSELEGMFGERLDEVRVHDDAEAAVLAEREGADAVAVGQDIAFAPGAYRPGTIDGDALIAHEVAHTIQQRSAKDLSPAAFRDDRSGEHAEEREADSAIAALLGRRLGGARRRMRIRQLRGSVAARRARICSKEPSLQEVQTAVDRAELITSVAAEATGNAEAARHLRRANQAFGQLGSHVGTAVDVQERAQDAWDIIDSLDNLERLQDDSGAWVDQQAAAVEFGRLFAAAGRIMEATNLPGLSSYGRFLAGASNFFSNMYEVVNVDAITRNRARRQNLEQYMP